MKQKKGKKERKEFRDIRTLFKQEEEKIIINLKEKVISGKTFILNGDKNRNLSLDDYLNKIEPYLRNIIIDLQNFDKLKIQLIIEIKFISSRDVRSDNIKFTSYNCAK